MRTRPHRNEPDDDLMRYCAHYDDTEAFTFLVQRHQPRILGYAARMLGGDTDAAADVAQEAFLCLWSHRARYQAQGKLLSYLLHVAHNKCVSEQRVSGRLSTTSLESSHDTPAASPLSDRAKAVRDAVIELPSEHRSVFVMAEYEGLTYAEIADVLEIPIGTVASRKNRAVQLLRIALSDWLNGEQGGVK